MTSKRPDKSHDLILWLFDGRCVKCGKRTNEVHEIEPRSHGKTSMRIQNRVAICRECHTIAHAIGTNLSIPILQEKRRKFLINKFGLNNE